MKTLSLYVLILSFIHWFTRPIDNELLAAFLLLCFLRVLGHAYPQLAQLWHWDTDSTLLWSDGDIMEEQMWCTLPGVCGMMKSNPRDHNGGPAWEESMPVSPSSLTQPSFLFWSAPWKFPALKDPRGLPDLPQFRIHKCCKAHSCEVFVLYLGLCHGNCGTCPFFPDSTA